MNWFITSFSSRADPARADARAQTSLASPDSPRAALGHALRLEMLARAPVDSAAQWSPT